MLCLITERYGKAARSAALQKGGIMDSTPLARKSIWRMTFDVLTFRFRAEDILAFDYRHLLFGLATTWIVGIGRAWHNPRMEAFQHWGLGSLGVMIGIALLIYLIILPLRPGRWSFFRVLTFVSLTALPGLVFAYPYPSGDTRAWLLLIVSAWRVALFSVFVARYTIMKTSRKVIGILLPIGLIVFCLTILDLQHVVLDLMGMGKPSPEDASYGLINTLTMLSVLGSPLLVGWYLTEIERARYS